MEIMEPEIARYIESILRVSPSITDEAIDHYVSALCISRYKRNAHCIDRGDVQTSTGYVLSGLVRAYYIDRKGSEINVAFIKEGGYVIHYGATVRSEPSKYSFQCIEPTVMINIPLEHIRICCARFAAMEHYLRLVIEQELYHKQQRIDSFIFENGEERYKRFLQENPDLMKRLTISQLASYLGMERQTLTRIRKRIM